MREAETIVPVPEGEPPQPELALGLTYLKAIEATNRDFVVGVQWHAESAEDAPWQARLFRRFVDAALRHELGTERVPSTV